MEYLKEDGSLDIRRINQLPIDEFTEMFPTLTQEQKEEYWSKSPLNEGTMGTQPVYVDYPMEQDGVDAFDFLNKMREKYGTKR